VQRWALSCFWRKDGVALWESEEPATPLKGDDEARRFIDDLAQRLGLTPELAIAAYEDPWRILRDEANLPLHLDPLAEDTRTESAGRRLSDRPAGNRHPVGYVLPLKAARAPRRALRPMAQPPWPLREGVPGRGRFGVGHRPAASSPEVLPEEETRLPHRPVRVARRSATASRRRRRRRPSTARRRSSSREPRARS
jgi:uncharacterized protein (DUF2126 family)